ncbi:hypothetical protein P9743_01390 [Anoxybacillus geothermalis]|nr:hypothetical protein [Anoxybacillus geothermalis]
MKFLKLFTNLFFITAVFIAFIALFLSFTFILFIINKGILIDSKNVDLFDIIVKASFTFIGSSLSGFVAFFIFFLNYRKDKSEEEKNQKKYTLKINHEYNRNKDILKSIYDAIHNVPSQDVSKILLEENSKIKELLLIQFSKIDLTFYQSFLKELNEKEYFTHIDRWNKIIRIHSYLDLILNKLKDPDNISIIVDELKREIGNL